MAISRKTIVAALGALLVSGAAGAYDQRFEYAQPPERERMYDYRAEYGPQFPYAAPSIEPGFTYSNRDRRDRRDYRNHWRGRDDPYNRDSRGVARDPAVQQHLDDITHGIAPPDTPAQDVGQYSPG